MRRLLVAAMNVKSRREGEKLKTRTSDEVGSEVLRK